MILQEQQSMEHLLPKYDFPHFLCNKCYQDFESNSCNQQKKYNSWQLLHITDLAINILAFCFCHPDSYSLREDNVPSTALVTCICKPSSLPSRWTRTIKKSMGGAVKWATVETNFSGYRGGGSGDCFTHHHVHMMLFINYGTVQWLNFHPYKVHVV
jgi:hypothetical protein